MKRTILLLGLWLGISFSVLGMEGDDDYLDLLGGIGFGEIDYAKLKSAGSYLLVKKEGKWYFLLGERNKPGKNEHQTLTSFHGNIIRENHIYDDTALDACRRNLFWELMLLEGDPKYVSVDDDEDELRIRKSKAKEFLDNLRPVATLKNRNWENEQRPSFVFVVDYDSVKDFVSGFAKNLCKNKWLPELSGLQLIDAAHLIEAIQAQVAKDQDQKNLITYGKFTHCDGFKIYDACSRTLAVEMEKVKKIIAEGSI